MEWFLLIVLVPLIVISIVLLYGFAGCTSFGAAPDPPAPPTPPITPPAGPPAPPGNLRVTNVGETSITLAWDHASPATVEFVITRTGLDLVPNANYAAIGQGIATTFTDGVLAPGSVVPGTVYSYTVRAKSSTDPTASPESNTVTVRTLKWEVAYDQALTVDDGVTLAGNSLVQRIDRATYLPFGGTTVRQVRLTLRGSTAGPGANTLIDLATISHVPLGALPGNPTPDPWDSEAVPLSLGAASLPVAGGPVMLGPTNFALNRTKDLLIAFDINVGNTNVARGRPTVGASQAYARANTAEAATTNRSPLGYANRPAGVYFVEKIEVLTA